jgi:hypothetical protein
MQAFKKVYQQALDLAESVSVQSKDGDIQDKVMLSTMIPSEEGTVVYDPAGQFQEFLLRLEDAILNHLLSCGPSVITESAPFFKEEAQKQLKSENVASVYSSTSPVGTIRFAIRILATTDPSTLLETIDQILAAIATKLTNVKPFRNSTLRSHAKSLATLKKFDISYVPFDDDPLADTLHLSRQQWFATTSSQTQNSQGGPDNAIYLSMSGSQQIHGMYSLMISSESPCFVHKDGFVISRSRTRMAFKIPNPFYKENLETDSEVEGEVARPGMEIDSLSEKEANSRDGEMMGDRVPVSPTPSPKASARTVTDSIMLFIWQISNPHLNASYFYCATSEPSALPPVTGWKKAGVGKLPAPLLAVVPYNYESQPGQRDNAGGNKGSPQGSQTISQDAFKKCDDVSLANEQRKKTESNLMRDPLTGKPVSKAGSTGVPTASLNVVATVAPTSASSVPPTSSSSSKIANISRTSHKNASKASTADGADTDNTVDEGVCSDSRHCAKEDTVLLRMKGLRRKSQEEKIKMACVQETTRPHANSTSSSNADWGADIDQLEKLGSKYIAIADSYDLEFAPPAASMKGVANKNGEVSYKSNDMSRRQSTLERDYQSEALMNFYSNKKISDAFRTMDTVDLYAQDEIAVKVERDSVIDVHLNGKFMVYVMIDCMSTRHRGEYVWPHSYSCMYPLAFTGLQNLKVMTEEKLQDASKLQVIVDCCKSELQSYEELISLANEKRKWLDNADEVAFLHGFAEDGMFGCASRVPEADARTYKESCIVTEEFKMKWMLQSCIDRAKESMEQEAINLRNARKEVEENSLGNKIVKLGEGIIAMASNITPSLSGYQSSSALADSARMPPSDRGPGTVIRELNQSPSRARQQVSWEAPKSPEDDLSLGDEFEHVTEEEARQERVLQASYLIAELLELAAPKSTSSAFVASVDVLGVEVWPPVKNPRPSTERLHYVLRFSLSDIKKSECLNEDVTFEQTPHKLMCRDDKDYQSNPLEDSMSDAADEIKAGDEFARINDLSKNSNNSLQEELQTQLDAQSMDAPKHTPVKTQRSATMSTSTGTSDSDGSTSRSAYQSFCAELRKRLKHQIGKESRLVFTVRRDLPSLCAFHSKLTELLSETDVLPPPFPDPFMIGTVEEEVMFQMLSASSTKRRLRFGQPFVYGEMIRHQLAKSLTGTGTNMDTLADYRMFDENLAGIQSYLQGVIALVESIDDDPNLHVDCDDVKQSLPVKLGQLLGQFLQANDLADIIEDNERQPSSRGGRTRGVGIGAAGGYGDGFAFPGGYDVYQQTSCRDQSLGGKAIEPQRPCFHPYLTSGLKLRVVIHDEQGGRLSLKKEEELLRTQRSKCIGCGEPLQSGLFGLDKNFAPCRYHGGLFCKRWCHADQHRVIPHRLVLYWDCKPHRVSRQAAAFLDHFGKRPVLQVNVINPLLYEGVPALRFVRNVKNRISSMLDILMDLDASQVQAIILDTLGREKIHVCACDELLSIEDLVSVQTGEMLSMLQKLLVALVSIAPPGDF